MAENLMNSAHKATNKEYREGWDRIFGTDGNIVACVVCGISGHKVNFCWYVKVFGDARDDITKHKGPFCKKCGAKYERENQG